MIRVDDDAATGVRTVTLDRPERRNALTTAMLADLVDAVETDLPVVHLRGAGTAFSAGADLDEVASLAGDGGDPAAFAARGQETMRAVAEAPAVVVAGVDGPARGGGVELALAADLRVATPDASFGEPGVSFGLFGTWGGTHRLPRVVGPSAAADIGLTGRVVGAEEAKAVGLVSRVVDDPAAVAEETAANDPHALAVVRDRLRDDRPVADRERAEREAFARLIDRHGDDL
ncbi:MAG: enoyl-CoA hydratase/isomerase family protein [Haloferacaceae archaeon]